MENKKQRHFYRINNQDRTKILMMTSTSMMALLTFTSCGVQNIEAVEDGVNDEIEVQKLDITCNKEDVWKTTRAGEDVPVTYYLFNSNNQCEDKKSTASINNNVSFSLYKKGTYKIYAITGLDATEELSQFTITKDSPFTIATPHDVCLGSSEVEFKDNDPVKKDVTISASHIFSQLSLTITDVPDDITSITATLQGLNNGFTLNGTASETQDITYSLTKNESSASDGSYTWELKDANTFNSTNGSATLLIAATDGRYTYHSTSTITNAFKKGEKADFTTKFDFLMKTNSSTSITDWNNSSNTQLEQTASYALPNLFTLYKNTKAVVVNIETDKEKGEATLTLMRNKPLSGKATTFRDNDVPAALVMEGLEDVTWKWMTDAIWTNILRNTVGDNSSTTKEAFNQTLTSTTDGQAIQDDYKYFINYSKAEDEIVPTYIYGKETKYHNIDFSIADTYYCYPICEVTIPIK